jgi:hypothetical protein
MTTEITPLPEDKVMIAAKYMAAGNMGKFAQHMGRAYQAATPAHRDAMLATFGQMFALAYDVRQITEGPTQ